MILYLYSMGWRGLVREALNVRLAPAPDVDHMAACNPDRVGHTTRSLRQLLELGVHHATLLCTQNGSAHGVAVKSIGNVVLRALETEIGGATVGQVIGRAAGSVVHVVGLHSSTDKLAYHLAEVDGALVGGFKGGLDRGTGGFVHGLRSGEVMTVGSGGGDAFELVVLHQGSHGLRQRQALSGGQMAKEVGVVCIGQRGQ